MRVDEAGEDQLTLRINPRGSGIALLESLRLADVSNPIAPYQDRARIPDVPLWIDCYNEAVVDEDVHITLHEIKRHWFELQTPIEAL